MKLHDTHFHLDLFDSPKTIIKNIEESTIHSIAVTNIPKLFKFTKDITLNSKYIRPALGLHPELAASHKNEIALFKELSSMTRYIGEVGLDNRKKTSEDYFIQKKVFAEILDTCAYKNKIISIHSRLAEADVVDMIGDNYPGKIILHWYSGNIPTLLKALNYGFYFSINSAMLKSQNGKKIIHSIPKDRILLESDGPFIVNNHIPSSPHTVIETANQLLKMQIISEIDELTRNFKALLI